MSFFPKEEKFRHVGKKMSILKHDTERLLPEKNWDDLAVQHAHEMEQADKALFNRILTDSDAPHKGKKTGSMFQKRENVNLFLPYGKAPPPPPKAPNVHYHDEDYYRQFLHPGHKEHRLREEQKIIGSKSLFDKNLSRNAVETYYSPNEKYADEQALSQQRQRYGHKDHGLLDELVHSTENNRMDRSEGKKSYPGRVGRGVLTDDTNPIPGFQGVGMGNHEHFANIKPKAATPTPTYDPLGHKAQKEEARERLRAVSSTPTHVFEQEYGMPSHLARKELPEYAKSLMERNPDGVPRDAPRCKHHYHHESPMKPDTVVVNGFNGLGLMCGDGGVPKQTGLKHCTPSQARLRQAPHKELPLFQAHQEAYRH